MATINYKIEFFSYWHTGSGLSAGTAANSTVIRNAYQLPYIPGKTIKGLLREAAEKIHHFSSDLVSKDFLEQVFGIGEDRKEAAEQILLEQGASTNGLSVAITPAICFFSNGELSNELSKALIKEKEYKWLYDTISSTAIGENGLAKQNALRTIEVTVPLTLFAKIEDFPTNPAFEKELDHCFKWIKRLGVNRNRGLGRCKWTKL